MTMLKRIASGLAKIKLLAKIGYGEVKSKEKKTCDLLSRNAVLFVNPTMVVAGTGGGGVSFFLLACSCACISYYQN